MTMLISSAFPSFTVIMILLLMLHLLVGVAVAQECDLTCYENAPCAFGAADFSRHPQPNGQPLNFHMLTVSPGGFHCRCPPGRTGLDCSKHYESCNDGAHACYNGGRCIPGLYDQYSNEQLYCDCSNAMDDQGNSYVGRYCEIPAPVLCDEGDDTVFCVNGGICRDDYQETPHSPCLCGDEYTGLHCEFRRGDVPNCTLSCQNGGACKLGIKSYEEAKLDFAPHWDAMSDSYQFCACPRGWMGLLCDRQSSRCGEHHCFNGATCDEKMGRDGNVLEHCDCTSANTKEKSYSGKYCQYESSKSDSIEKSRECKLACVNGGKCRKGAKDFSLLHQLGLSPSELTSQITPLDSNFEWCDCPEGWTGLRCEIKLEKCGDGDDHVCLHGSKCIRDGDTFGCSCDHAFTPFEKYAGRSCEHKSSEICTDTGIPGLAGKANNFAFCVNGGTCKANVTQNEIHKGCACPAGWMGNHCEINEATSSLDTSIPHMGWPSSRSPGMNKALIAIVSLMIALTLAVSAGAFAWIRKKRNSHLSSIKGQASVVIMPSNPSWSTPPRTVWPTRHDCDIDRGRLHNVDIL